MSVLSDPHQYTLEQLAKLMHIKRQVADGQLQAVEALDQLRQIALPGVQVASLKPTVTEIVLDKMAEGR
jgi:hypothetical protein